MIYTLTGSNSYLFGAELKRLVAEFVKLHTDMGLERIDGEDAEYDKIREALESLPFLASRKLVVLRAPSANKEFVDKSQKLLDNIPDSTDVIIVETKLDKRSVYYKYLLKNTQFKQFNELDENALSRWLVERATVQGSSLKSPDARYLVERVGANQQMLASEISKLSLHNKIDKKLIDELTEASPSSTIFQLLDAGFAGNKQQVMRIYKEQRASKVEPQQIIAMLAWQLHIIAVIKTSGDRSDETVASDAKINPFVVRKSRAIADKLTPTKLTQLVNNLTELDQKLKSQSIDADDAVMAYLLAI